MAMVELFNTLAIGGIGIVGTLLGAGWTTRQTARDRQRQACQQILLLTQRVREEVLVESHARQAKEFDRETEATAAVGRVVAELTIAAIDIPKKKRPRIMACIDAISERDHLAASPTMLTDRAAWTIDQLVHAHVDRAAVPDNFRQATENFIKGVTDVRMAFAEEYRQIQEAEAEHQERKRFGHPGDLDDR